MGFDLFFCFVVHYFFAVNLMGCLTLFVLLVSCDIYCFVARHLGTVYCSTVSDEVFIDHTRLLFTNKK